VGSVCSFMLSTTLGRYSVLLGLLCGPHSPHCGQEVLLSTTATSHLREKQAPYGSQLTHFLLTYGYHGGEWRCHLHCSFSYPS